MKFEPAEKVIVCERAENKSESGLELPDGEDSKHPETGKVIAIGKGKLPVEIKVGDTIVYLKYAESETTIGGKEFNFIQFKNIAAKIK